MFRICRLATLALMAGAIGVSSASAQKTTPGSATLYFSVTNPDGSVAPFAITPDAGGAYPGTFDRGGNFSFDLAATTRKVCFNFSQPLPLLNPPRIANVPPPLTDCYAASFTILGNADGSSITTIAPGTTIVRSTRFSWTNTRVTGMNDPDIYHVGFRGDAVLDGRTEMSKVKVTCNAGDATGCRNWTLEPCVTFDNWCGPQHVPINPDGSVVGAAVGQVSAYLPKGKGNTEILRYILPWRMTIVR